GYSFILLSQGTCILSSRNQVTVTQPPVVTFTPGSTVTLNCKVSTPVYICNNVNLCVFWYQQKSGEAPKLLIRHLNVRHSGTPEVFVRPLNEFISLWWTFGGGTKLIIHLGVVRPTLTVLPPSTQEVQQSSATLVCLASGGFPSAWRLGWKVGGSSRSSGVSNSLEVLGRDGHYSWSSTLSLPAEQWRKAGSVSCEASLDGHSPVSQSLDP
uniref:Zgc:153659 n=1 Tax=Acanthochromis polyacanthus TaxID=80966 RepID=A0A3Q1EE62_9TELE